ASKRIFGIYHEEKETYNQDSPNLIEKNGDIIFNNVSFSYNSEADVLKNVSFSIPHKKTTAFVGPSGSGKSTILNLIEKMYIVNQGEVLYADENINRFNLKKWREKL